MSPCLIAGHATGLVVGDSSPLESHPSSVERPMTSDERGPTLRCDGCLARPGPLPAPDRSRRPARARRPPARRRARRPRPVPPGRWRGRHRQDPLPRRDGPERPTERGFATSWGFVAPQDKDVPAASILDLARTMLRHAASSRTSGATCSPCGTPRSTQTTCRRRAARHGHRRPDPRRAAGPDAARVRRPAVGRRPEPRDPRRAGASLQATAS